ncbi:hypothetical protein G3T36_02520 [Diaminobutyricibacter tongyongensis]|uniref:Uncharacterized protein n=1 Tax=Leifsonia tongyongensis TaxID=1268043 RepID=A0A6L9XUH8_9MICO|nr:hypothetical protein [Diaminobutyricibacter tongyongensis]NEN04734.1 hypothetical protein [Diaminobutyricibacter tongyongensis]
MAEQQHVSRIDHDLVAILKGAYRPAATRSDLAERTGIKIVRVQRLMAGKSGFTIEQLYAIFNAIRWKRLTA